MMYIGRVQYVENGAGESQAIFAVSIADAHFQRARPSDVGMLPPIYSDSRQKEANTEQLGGSVMADAGAPSR